MKPCYPGFSLTERLDDRNIHLFVRLFHLFGQDGQTLKIYLIKSLRQIKDCRIAISSDRLDDLLNRSQDPGDVTPPFLLPAPDIKWLPHNHSCNRRSIEPFRNDVGR